MKDIFQQEDFPKPPKIGEIIEGKIIGKEKASVFLDLGPVGTGIIYGREFYEAKDQLKEKKIGEGILAKVVDMENEQGYIELSLSRAGKELAWDALREKKEKGELIKVKISGANKGGLLAEVSGIPAFLPASQLAPENYPKVEGGDNQKILKTLQKFIGKEMEVKIFDLNQREEKIILSEKAKEAEKLREMIQLLKAGDEVEGEITGIVDFGAFIKFSLPGYVQKEREPSTIVEGKPAMELEGLIHISELDWQLVEEPSQIVKLGQKVKAKIIEISQGKIFLSLKALKKDPWRDLEEKYKKGDIVKGEVTKFNPFGAFIKISPKIQGLCHISEFGSQKKMEETLKIKKKYDFQILSLEPKEHRMTLKFAS